MSQNLPLVTAVIPVYNGERFLFETIESVLAQTYPNIECIVVNDGSTDDTGKVVQSFGDKVRYFEKPNGGVSSARNLGIEKAEGELIAFLDADDLWQPEKIEKQVALYREHQDVGMIYSGVRLVNETGIVHGEIKDGFDRDPLVRILMLETPVYLTMTALVPRKVLSIVGGFDERLSTSADADLACRIAMRFEMLAIDEALADYRQHAAQMHLNLAALENDMNLVFQKVFDSEPIPDRIRGLRPEANASLECTLAIANLSQSRFRKGVTHLWKAFSSHPGRTFQCFSRLLTRRTR
jgi:glycosyltransferase involved in cell wall biosynthesis